MSTRPVNYFEPPSPEPKFASGDPKGILSDGEGRQVFNRSMKVQHFGERLLHFESICCDRTCFPNSDWNWMELKYQCCTVLNSKVFEV